MHYSRQGMLWLIDSLSRVFRLPFDPQRISHKFPPPTSVRGSKIKELQRCVHRLALKGEGGKAPPWQATGNHKLMRSVWFDGGMNDGFAAKFPEMGSIGLYSQPRSFK